MVADKKMLKSPICRWFDILNEVLIFFIHFLVTFEVILPIIHVCLTKVREKSPSKSEALVG